MESRVILQCLMLAAVAGVIAGVPLPRGVDPRYGKLFQGDIKLPPGFDIKNGIIGDNYRWPGNVVPYEMDGEFSADERNLILGSLGEISDKTCIRFVQRTNEPDWVFIDRGTPNSGCWSYVGRIGGRQNLNLQPGPGAHCIWHGTAAHEMIHAIGFFHEQSRIDRDDYVIIQWDNIQPGTEGNFEKINTDAQGVTYDYLSLMHYDAYAFALDPSRPTIVPKIDTQIGQNNGLTDKDAQKIRNMYRC
ncbi:unnamed protein product [Orchesella dallaii]|uniref:Metalloendopeptidase n=1 Tax=Orchesella dallaii TaxID=48710 RepID=A0ABP1RYQ5_9HEXA